MSFLGQIKSFNKTKLQKTETEITTEDGRRLKETHDADGTCHTQVIGVEHGYVVDLEPDMQVAEVLPGLLLGSQDVATDFATLEKHFVTHILNVASMVPNAFPGNFKYKQLNILDLDTTDIRDYFDEAFEFIAEGMKEGCVLVHCNAGRSRSASIVIGYLMNSREMTYEEATSLVKSKRPSINPNPGFVRQLKHYRP